MFPVVPRQDRYNVVQSLAGAVVTVLDEPAAVGLVLIGCVFVADETVVALEQFP